MRLLPSSHIRCIPASMIDRFAKAIDERVDDLVQLTADLIRFPTINPPGEAYTPCAEFVGERLRRRGFAVSFMRGEGTPGDTDRYPRTNVVARIEGRGPGPVVHFNSHIDVVEAGEGWTVDPFGGVVRDGRVYGRGACDMKAGTTASIFTYRYLHRLRDKLKGRLTLTCVSDEETFGPWGARYLVDNCPEVLGDCVLNGEPSGTNTVRFGEKGPFWLAFNISSPGAHGAYTHLTVSASKIASQLIADLEVVTAIPPNLPHNIARAVELAEPAVDVAMGKGAAEIVPKVTLNIGVVSGGLKVNMIPGQCRVEADIRLPLGVEKETIMKEVRKIVARYPEVTFEEINFNPPSYCDPYGEMMEIVQSNVKQLSGVLPVPIVSLGGTDARLWRYRNIPAYVYGPPPTGMGSYDERVTVDDFLHVVRTHVLSAYDYLMK